MPTTTAAGAGDDARADLDLRLQLHADGRWRADGDAWRPGFRSGHWQLVDVGRDWGPAHHAGVVRLAGEGTATVDLNLARPAALLVGSEVLPATALEALRAAQAAESGLRSDYQRLPRTAPTTP